MKKIKIKSINTENNTIKTIPHTAKKLSKEQKNKKDNAWDWLPLDYISYSTISSFESCPVSWYLEHLCDIKWPMTYKMNRGVIFQNALNLKYKDQDYLSELQKLQDWQKLDPLIKKLPNLNDIISIDSPHFVDFGIGIPVKFTPDFLTDNKIIDAKLSSGYYNKNSVQKMTQLTIYKEGAKRLFGIDTKLFYWIFNDVDYTFQEIEVDRNQQDTNQMIEWFQNKLTEIQQCYNTGHWIIPMHTRFKCNLNLSCPIKMHYAI